MARDAETFGDLIAPLSVDDFFADYWESTFLHLHGEPGRFSGYFSFGAIDSWLGSTRGGVVFALYPEGETTRIETHPAHELTPRAVYANFTRGFAQILKFMADWPPLHGLVKSLGRDFHADVHVNAFVTPAGARTYSTYTAENDVLVLQLEGEEVWRLHEFSVLQLPLTEKKNLKFPPEWYGRTTTPVRAEVRLEPGDLLFIPRGMPHHVESPAAASLHLRIYITALSWMDFLKIAAEHAAIHAQELRRALPPGFVDSDEIRERMRGTFREVMSIFREVSFDDVLAVVERNRVAKQGTPSDGHFAQLVGADDLAVDSEVERRRDVLCTVDDVVDGERRPRSAIFFGQEQVNGPPHLRRALEFIRDHPRFRVSEIPGLDVKGQLVLVRRLIAEGLLRRRRAAQSVAVEVPEPVAP